MKYKFQDVGYELQDVVYILHDVIWKKYSNMGSYVIKEMPIGMGQLKEQEWRMLTEVNYKEAIQNET